MSDMPKEIYAWPWEQVDDGVAKGCWSPNENVLSVGDGLTLYRRADADRAERLALADMVDGEMTLAKQSERMPHLTWNEWYKLRDFLRRDR
jgi:hypothetical protein